MCCYKNNADISMFLLVMLNVCFFSNPGRVKRVVGGIEVKCGIQPRMASLRNSSTLQHLCGATLLSQDFAVTAAHCVHYSGDDYVLQLNNYCVGDEAMVPKAQVLEIIPYELYNRDTRAHDIALLRIMLDLDDVMWLNDSVLPSSSFGVSGECTLYGYGYTDVNMMETSEKLHAGKLNIVSLDECTLKLGPYVAPKYDSGMMCAIGDGVDACQGDSGSPLICTDGLMQGISSYGMSCAVPGVPGVYTSIGAHLQWIHGVMEHELQSLNF